MYKMHLLPKAEKFFARADLPLARKLASCFKSLEVDPLHHPNIKKLLGPLKGLHRFRAGDYHIIYRIDAPKKTVFVLRIAHRKEAYDWKSLLTSPAEQIRRGDQSSGHETTKSKIINRDLGKASPEFKWHIFTANHRSKAPARWITTLLSAAQQRTWRHRPPAWREGTNRHGHRSPDMVQRLNRRLQPQLSR